MQVDPAFLQTALRLGAAVHSGGPPQDALRVVLAFLAAELDVASVRFVPTDPADVAEGLDVTVPIGAPPGRSAGVVPVLEAGQHLGDLVLQQPAGASPVDPADPLLGAAALALAGLMARARAARLTVEVSGGRDVAVRRLEVLLDVATMLSQARDTSTVLDVAVGRVRQLLGATTSLVLTVEDTMFHLVGAEGARPETMQRYKAPFPIDPVTPAGRAVLERRTVHLLDLAERDALYPQLRGQPAAAQGYVALPMVVEGRSVGALVIGWPEPHPLPAQEKALLEALAGQCAQALDRARLFDAEREARRSAELTAERLRRQQRLASDLSGAQDVRSVVATVLIQARETFGAERARLARMDHRRREFVVLGAVSAGAPGLHGGGEVFASGAATPERDAVASGATLQRCNGSLVCVPLVLHGRARGVLTLSWRSARTWAVADLDLMAALAAQCAQALERARLWEHTRWVADTLQQSLLPSRLPQVPGLEVAVRYRPVSRRAEVGGDFYDVFRIAAGRYGLVIGDVSGKGVPAATLTSLARHTVRTAARHERSPAAVLGVLNDAVLEAGEQDDRFVTVVYLEVAPQDGRARVRLSVGGHPLPLLRRADGQVRPVGRTGMAVGLVAEPDLYDVDLLMEPEDTLALFTDGVTEARDAAGAFVGDLPESVMQALPAHAGAQEVADRLERAVLECQGGQARDDLAVLVLRVAARPPA